MIAGASWVWWAGFHAVVLALVAADWMLPGSRSETRHPQLFAWIGTAAMVLVAAGFAVWVGFAHGERAALEYVTGYTIELSLSADNLIVFLVLFQGFRVDSRRQHTALLWGVGGAIILRALFIAAGVTLLDRFGWVTWIFGLFLLYAAWRMLRGGSARAAIPEWVRRMQTGKGSLLPIILAVELTDLIFAIDSIPAVLAVTHNPFVAYTSNIAAVLGLRSMFFALKGALDKLRYLHYGLAALLGFVALKMLAGPWFDIPINASLLVIGSIMAACVAASLLAGKAGNQKSREQGVGNRE